MKLSDRLRRLELLAGHPAIARDLEVIKRQLARAEDKILRRSSEPLAQLQQQSAGQRPQRS